MNADASQRDDRTPRAAMGGGRVRTERLGLLVAILAALFLLGCHIRWIAEPFSASLGGTTSASYYGYAARAFDTHGFFALKGAPATFYFPSTREGFIPYLNHPPFAHLVTYPSYLAFGKNERALRLPILLLMLGIIVGVHRAAKAIAPDGAAAATAIAAAIPLFFEYGNMVDAPMFSTALLAPTIVLWFRWRKSGKRSAYAAFFLFALAGALVDWFNFLIVPALWLEVFCAKKDTAHGSRWKVAFLAGLPVGIGLVLFLAWLIAVTGGPSEALATMRGLMAVPAGLDPKIAARKIEYFPNMAVWFRRGVGPVILGFFAIGVASILLRAGEPAAEASRRAFLVLLFGGAAPSVVFWSRAAEHEFWILPLAPALAIGAAAGIRAVAALAARAAHPERRAVLSTGLAIVIALGVVIDAAMRGIRLHRTFATTIYRERGAALNEVAGPRDVVFMPEDEDQVRFYSRSALAAPCGQGLDNLKTIVRGIAPVRNSIDRFFLGIPTTHLDQAGWALALRPIIRGTREIAWGDRRLALTELDPAGLFELASR